MGLLAGYITARAGAVAGCCTPLYGGSMKSHESDQVSLVSVIYYDAMAKCVAIQPDLRDLMTIKSRVEDEGLSFLTITLPQFGKDFERSLADEVIDSTFFRSFKKNGAIPAFLQGMLSQIFDRTTGRILHETPEFPSIIEGIRQIAYSFKKLEIDCTLQRVRSSLRNFVQTEHELSGAHISGKDVKYFIDVSHALWGSIPDIQNISDIIPKHGPGGTSDGFSGNQKYRWKFWHERLEPYFPFIETAYTLGCYNSEEFKDVTLVSQEQEEPVKVTTVPKTQKGPRIIALEPCCMQYAQQAVRSYLYDKIEQNYYSAGHVNFTDQSINRILAMKSSLTGDLASLDLSDASDRVIGSLAVGMFKNQPVLQGMVLACRSTHAKLPDGKVIGPLVKFASMGSALCFPVESMYFYTLCVAALLKCHNLPVTSRNVYNVSRDVYIYGDDIFVPSRWATTVVDHLQKYYCKVNMTKSFWNGKFRESCGMDAYAGEEVTPTYIKHLHPDNRRQAERLISWVKTANLFFKKGYWRTSSYMFNVCERYLGRLPVVAETSPALGRISHLPYVSAERWNRKTHAWEIRAWVGSPVYRTDVLGGYG
ncbi:TPA_asm: RNA-directed RNA polymerase, partial [ssRNA phage SRR6960549_7]